MFNKHSVEIDWGGRPLKLETGKIARQADGAVLATYGETVVLATVVAAKNPREGVDFLPLTVDYQEKTYAARSARYSSTAGATRPRSSSPCCRMTWRTIPTFWRWSPPPPR
jgi:ribonuclease PH